MPAKVTIVPPAQPTVTLEVSARQAQMIHKAISGHSPRDLGFDRKGEPSELYDLYDVLDASLRKAGLVTGVQLNPEYPR